MSELQNEFRDVGRGTDKPKGFVKWSLIAYWAAIIGLSGTVGTMFKLYMSAANDCARTTKEIMATMQQTIDDIRKENEKKLEERLARFEHLEQRVDSLPQNKAK